ncbi:hypothetical protein NPIL_677641 [Nephila pilipes]|uniref:Uncharacterized protein n=1 Tax=Nephila pilipes TaxID=299642 RepID=A0A8X6U2P9_NEPPI|nr:hypothetical protein NPIL_677641 [Nephila pilipes]
MLLGKLDETAFKYLIKSFASLSMYYNGNLDYCFGTKLSHNMKIQSFSEVKREFFKSFIAFLLLLVPLDDKRTPASEHLMQANGAGEFDGGTGQNTARQNPGLQQSEAGNTQRRESVEASIGRRRRPLLGGSRWQERRGSMETGETIHTPIYQF